MRESHDRYNNLIYEFPLNSSSEKSQIKANPRIRKFIPRQSKVFPKDFFYENMDDNKLLRESSQINDKYLNISNNSANINNFHFAINVNTKKYAIKNRLPKIGSDFLDLNLSTIENEPLTCPRLNHHKSQFSLLTVRNSGYFDEIQTIDVPQISKFDEKKIIEKPRHHHQRKQFSMNLFSNIQPIKEKDCMTSPKIRLGFLFYKEINFIKLNRKFGLWR